MNHFYYNKKRKKTGWIGVLIILILATIICFFTYSKDNKQRFELMLDDEMNNSSRLHLYYESSADRYTARINSADNSIFLLSSMDLTVRKDVSNSTLRRDEQALSSSSIMNETTLASIQNEEQEIMEEDASSAAQENSQSEVVENELHRLLNELRQEKGFTNLERVAILNEAARLRAEEASSLFSHTRPNGKAFYTVLSDLGYTGYLSCGENLAYRTTGEYTTDEDLKLIAGLLFEQWVESEGHYNNMINETFNLVGVGVNIKENKFTAAQIFVYQ